MNKQRRRGLLGLGVVLGCAVLASGLYDFLAISRPVDANVMVIEGWIWNSTAMPEAVAAINRGHYDWVVTVGDPVRQGGEESTAERAAARIQDLGVDPNCLVVLKVPTMPSHQTYTSALTVRRWLATAPTPVTGVNVFTLGTHARKSLVLFKRALGAQVKVGVIAGTEDTFDPNRWWCSSRGIYVVARKTLGYLYAVLWPLPDPPPP